MKVTRVGFDIAKPVFQVHGVDENGKVKVGKTLAREKVLEYFAQLPPCLVGMRHAAVHTTGVASSASSGTR